VVKFALNMMGVADAITRFLPIVGVMPFSLGRAQRREREDQRSSSRLSGGEFYDDQIESQESQGFAAGFGRGGVIQKSGGESADDLNENQDLANSDSTLNPDAETDEEGSSDEDDVFEEAVEFETDLDDTETDEREDERQLKKLQKIMDDCQVIVDMAYPKTRTRASTPSPLDQTNVNQLYSANLQWLKFNMQILQKNYNKLQKKTQKTAENTKKIQKIQKIQKKKQ